MRMRRLVPAAAASFLATAVYAHPGHVHDAEAADVASCAFVADVGGRSVFGERLAAEGAGQAKSEARAAAAKAGATHVVWDKPVRKDVTTISGKAYRCGH